MGKINITKLTVGLIIISIPFLMGLNFIFYYYGIDTRDPIALYYALWYGDNTGSASNTPFFLGLMAIAGAIIIASITNDKTDKK